MRILLLGSGGLLGRALRDHAPASHAIVAPVRSELDVRDGSAVAEMVADVRPQAILNAAAYTDVDGAERSPEAAHAVNAIAVGGIGRIARAHACVVLHFSTDYVFDGHRAGCYDETDATAPVNTYGATKLAGEKLLRDSGADHLIIRTQWLFGVGGKSFLSRAWDLALAGRAINVVNDEFGQCTYVRDLADVAWRLVTTTRPRDGIVHVANRGRVSRFDVARRIFAAHASAELVTPCPSRAVQVLAPRPSESVLCLDRVEGVLGQRLPVWTDAVDRFVEAQRRSPLSAARR